MSSIVSRPTSVPIPLLSLVLWKQFKILSVIAFRRWPFNKYFCMSRLLKIVYFPCRRHVFNVVAAAVLLVTACQVLVSWELAAASLLLWLRGRHRNITIHLSTLNIHSWTSSSVCLHCGVEHRAVKVSVFYVVRPQMAKLHAGSKSRIHATFACSRLRGRASFMNKSCFAAPSFIDLNCFNIMW